MPVLKKFFIHLLMACPICHGMKVVEVADGSTRECWHCKGKGYL